MRRLIVALTLTLALTGCRVVTDGAQVRTLMYWPAIDGAPVQVEKGRF